MVSNSQTQDGCDAAYHALASAFGEPVPVSGGLRWAVTKESGTQVVVELSFPARGVGGSVVWIFDPDAVGVSSFSSLDVGTPDGLAWLDMEVRRLRRA